MHVFIINLDAAPDRWQFVSGHFGATELRFTRVPGIVGKNLTLPHPQYREKSFARRHGQRTNLSHVGCYLSHLKALQTFLDSPHSHGIISEDDALPVKNLGEILERAIQQQSTWDILRLCGFHHANPQPYATLIDDYKLSVCMTRLCGTGAYLVTRHAAEVLLRTMTPMTLPIDHAIDREWAYGLRAAAVMPLPIQQWSHEFVSQCSENRDHKLPWFKRYWTVLPYRTWNETSRVFHRARQLRLARQNIGWQQDFATKPTTAAAERQLSFAMGRRHGDV